MLISAADPDPRIVRTAPMLCVEVLSSEDRMREIEERIQDYAGMGVPCMWVVDPWRRVAYMAGPDGILHEVRDRLIVEGTSISADVEALFAELDRRQARTGSSLPHQSATAEPKRPEPN